MPVTFVQNSELPTEYIDEDDVQLGDDVLWGGEEEGHQQQDRVGCHLQVNNAAGGQVSKL